MTRIICEYNDNTGIVKWLKVLDNTAPKPKKTKAQRKKTSKEQHIQEKLI